MTAWDPIILGITPEKAKTVLSNALNGARERGVHGANDAQVEVSPADNQTGARVIIHGLSEERAKALWEEHLRPALDG